MDGSNIRTLTDSVRSPVSLRLDLPLLRLYWAESDLNQMDSVAVDGTKRMVRVLTNCSAFITNEFIRDDLFAFEYLSAMGMITSTVS